MILNYEKTIKLHNDTPVILKKGMLLYGDGNGSSAYNHYTLVVDIKRNDENQVLISFITHITADRIRTYSTCTRDAINTNRDPCGYHAGTCLLSRFDDGIKECKHHTTEMREDVLREYLSNNP